MKKLSRLSVSSALYCLLVFLVPFIILIASCSAPTKTAKPIAESSGKKRNLEGVGFNSQNSDPSKQSVERKLDEISGRLEKIEQVLGLNEAEPQADEQNLFAENEDSSLVDADPNIPTSSIKSEDITKELLSPEEKYNRARSLLLANQFNAAEKEFKSVTEQYPDHPLAVNSFYWMGECRYSVKDYKRAIAIFKQLVDKYPNGRKVPDALLKTAYAYLSINDKDNAREYLKTVVRKFPFSPAGEKAERKLQSLK